MKKVTMQEIADELGVSRVSVWKVFNDQPGISDSLKKNVLDMATKLGYNKFNDGINSIREEEISKTISLVVSRPNSSIFWTDIIHSLAKELANNDINVIYTYVPSTYNKNFKLPRILTSKDIDGIITLNIYDTNMIEKINSLSIPKVFLDSIPNSEEKQNYDLLLTEGKNTVFRLVEHVIKNGATKLGFIGDITYARTNLERYDGFCAALSKLGIEYKKKYCLTNSIGIYKYQSMIFDYLDSLDDMPDAFICVSDYVAQFVNMYLGKHNHSNVIITGFDGSTEYSNVSDKISTAYVNTKWIGKKLALQILFRMKNQSAPFETIYVHPELRLI